MNFSHYSDSPVALAVDLVNTLGSVSGTDSLAAPDDLAAFVDQHNAEWPHQYLTERDLHEVRALRSRLREVFAAPDGAAAAAVLNEALADAGVTPRVSVHGESSPHLHFEPRDGSPARWLTAVTVMGLATALVEGGFERLGTCAAASCDDVFVDTSRNRSRSHCSSTCTTRENVAAYRKRKTSGSAE